MHFIALAQVENHPLSLQRIYNNSRNKRRKRGSGVLPKGQHSWNISVTKKARVDPKVVLESSMECPFWESFFACNFFFKRTNILQNDTSSSLIGYKTGRAH